MADVDIDLFGEHESRPEEPTGENISLIPVGGSTWKPEHEQETSFGGEGQRTRFMKKDVKRLYQKLFENIGETSEPFDFDYFKLENGELYYRGRNELLMHGGGKLKSFNLGFLEDEVTDEQVEMLNRVEEEELPSASDVAKADDIEIQEITENAMKSTEDLIAQFEGQETLPTHELLGLDKQLRSIRGFLKVEVAKKVQLEGSIKKEKCKLEEL